MKDSDIRVGQQVRLHIQDRGRSEDDLRYLRRQGRYSAPKYGPTVDNTVLTIVGIVDDYYAQLSAGPDDYLMRYLALPSELELVEDTHELV